MGLIFIKKRVQLIVQIYTKNNVFVYTYIFGVNYSAGLWFGTNGIVIWRVKVSSCHLKIRR